MTQAMDPPRSTAYYYGDLERIKRAAHLAEDPNQLSEYVEANEVINDSPIREVPPLRDRPRQSSLPEYSTPEGPRKLPGETYSTAGTFPMPQPKEKEPLLSELEVVGRLPLSQLEGTGVRRSRSWYLCCPNVGEDEVSRNSSWRYSSLRPVTQPPVPQRNGPSFVVATTSSAESVAALKAERAALTRSLEAERQRAAAQARAHEARLAELHGVIAELMRRRDASAQQQILEETSDHTDECESTTQPAAELDNDADQSRTDQNDTSSRLSMDGQQVEDISERLNTSVCLQESSSCERDNIVCAKGTAISERDSDLCLSTARCCGAESGGGGGGGGGGGAHSHTDTPTHTDKTGRCESREPKMASRVRLRKTEEGEHSSDDAWCSMAERLSMEVCAQADLREALVLASTDSTYLQSVLSWWCSRAGSLEAELRVAEGARDAAIDTAYKMYMSCACLESRATQLCVSLRAADRALEAYDVLLALAETTPGTEMRESSERVALAVLTRLEEDQPCSEEMLPPGPWLDHAPVTGGGPWSDNCERRLREAAARLKAETAAARAVLPPPVFFSYHDMEEELPTEPTNKPSMVDMEAAVMMQEVALARSERAGALSALAAERARGLTNVTHGHRKSNSTRSRRRHPREERLWLDASETDL